MNSHEIERIADAMHHLRPDWPTRQLKTLLASPQLADRPRRDVCVALAWVACEPATANPYRVLEAGPWWRAAAIEGAAKSLNKVPRERRCSTCSLDRDRCRQLWANDHDFEPDFKTKRDPETAAQIVTALRGEMQPTATKATDDTVANSGAGRARVEAALTTTHETTGTKTKESDA